MSKLFALLGVSLDVLRVWLCPWQEEVDSEALPTCRPFAMSEGCASRMLPPHLKRGLLPPLGANRVGISPWGNSPGVAKETRDAADQRGLGG